MYSFILKMFVLAMSKSQNNKSRKFKLLYYIVSAFFLLIYIFIFYLESNVKFVSKEVDI